MVPKKIDDLVEANEKLAYQVLWEYYPKLKQLIELDDAQQLCLEGLIQAAKSFNEDKLVAFSTFAYACIRNNLLKHTIGVKKRNIPTISLESNIDDTDICLKDTIPDSINLEEFTMENEELKLLHQFIYKLPEPKKTVINYRLLGYSKAKTAEIMNLSYNEVRNYYNQGLNILRKKFKEKGMM